MGYFTRDDFLFDIANNKTYFFFNVSSFKNLMVGRDETKLKLLKWNFTVPRQEFVDQLNDQMVAANFNKSLMSMMFHSDFKQHLKAIGMLTGASCMYYVLNHNINQILDFYFF